MKFNNKTQTLWDHLKKPESNIFNMLIKIPARPSVLFAVESETKYEGYISIQSDRVKNIKKLENIKIPPTFNFLGVPNLSSESLEKLIIIKPETLGQAIRIDGVRKSDVSVLSLYLYKK